MFIKYVCLMGVNWNSRCFVVLYCHHIYKKSIQLFLGLSLLSKLQGKKSQHLTTLIVNTCDHYDFGVWLGLSMTKLNVVIDIYFKNVRYFISKGKIVTKINVHCLQMYCQLIFLFMAVNNVLFWLCLFINNCE